MAPNVRLRTFGYNAADWLEAERNVRAGGMEDHLDAARRERVREDISRRLKRACSHLPDNEFHLLVEQMVDRQINGERRVIRDLLLE